jgi:flagellar hook protein FlgE
MIDSIYVGMTGLAGFSGGLRVIANNTTNLNTPGFKSSNLQFTDLFYSRDSVMTGSSDGGYSQRGYGLNMAGTSLSFKQGDLQQTSNGLDLAIDGQGFFMLRDDDGNLSYTRAGQFRFDDAGVLRDSATEQRVMRLGAGNDLQEINLTGVRTNAGRATTRVIFKGNLSSTATSQTVNGVKVIDALGGEHTLDVRFTNLGTTTPASWTAELLEGTTVVGSGQIQFQSGLPLPGNSTVTLTYSPAGVAPIPLVLDFSTDVTSFASANVSTLAMNSQDGRGPGNLTGVTFSATGAMQRAYSNGQVISGAQLAVIRFDLDSMDTLESVGDNRFISNATRGWEIGAAGSPGFGSIASGTLEKSNVDLSQEFSNLVIMQRGYQASSQVVTTANEMLQQLFSMKSK